MVFGIKTGKQLAIKPSNLRRIAPDDNPDPPEEEDSGPCREGDSTPAATPPGTSQSRKVMGKDEGAAQSLQPRDRVMIYGLASRKELNGSHGTLIQFDQEAQRWGVELMAFGIKTGKQLAIKPSNLRRISQGAKPDPPEEDDSGAHSGQSSDEFWSGGSFGEDSGDYSDWQAAIQGARMRLSSSSEARPAAFSGMKYRGRALGE